MITTRTQLPEGHFWAETPGDESGFIAQAIDTKQAKANAVDVRAFFNDYRAIAIYETAPTYQPMNPDSSP